MEPRQGLAEVRLAVALVYAVLITGCRGVHLFRGSLVTRAQIESQMPSPEYDDRRIGRCRDETAINAFACPRKRGYGTR